MNMPEACCAWPAPAKLNLFLHIVGRRPDGYHRLQTVFQFLDLGDLLDFRLRPDGVVRRVTDLPGVSQDEDLTVQAARLLQREGGTSLGVDIAIDKRIPTGGGLGGGSSDAATTLVALNRLWELGLPSGRLAELGLSLGADVPVFLAGRAAWAEGVGERLEPVEVAEPWYLVIAPQVSVSTAAVFADPELTRDCPPITIRDFLDGRAGNVCEPVVRRRHPEVAQALDWLDRFANARMTGTGACVFARFDDEAQARRLHGALPAPWTGFVAKGMNRSPLLRRLDAA